MPITRRWILLARRWAWAAPASALGLTAVELAQGQAQSGARAVLAGFGVRCAVAFVLWAVAVLACGFARRPAQSPPRPQPSLRQVMFHASAIAVIATAFALSASRSASSWVPEHFGFREAIAAVTAAQLGVGVAAAISFALHRRLPGLAYPTWLWALAHLCARALTADDLARFAQGHEGVIDLASLALVFACLAAQRSETRRPWAGRVSAWTGAAAAVWALSSLHHEAALRRRLVARDPSATAMVSWLRATYDLDGDGFASVLGGGDCDDGNPLVHPMALELVGNGVDDNCGGGDLERHQPASMPTLLPGGPRRNLLLITIDAMRADVSGPDQSAPAPMPGLRAFAVQAAVFPRTYVQAPYTTDSLQVLITGHYPMNMTLGMRWLGSELDLPTLLRGAGYRTQAVHALWLRDPNTKVVAETSTFLVHFEGVDRTLATKNQDPLASTAAEITRRALAHFERLRGEGRPFFLWVHYFDLHADYASHSGTPFAGNTPRERYLQEAFTTDMAVTRLLRAVESSGFYDNGITVVTGDHGELFGEHGHTQHALWMEEAALKTTLLLRGPGLAPGRYDTRVRLIDVAPTVLEQAAGIRIAADGRSLLPIIEQREHTDRAVFVRSMYAERVYKRAALVGPWKLVQDLGAGTVELYRLDRDPGEDDDLADEQSAERDRLLNALGQTFDRAMNDRVLAARRRH